MSIVHIEKILENNPLINRHQLIIMSSHIARARKIKPVQVLQLIAEQKLDYQAAMGELVELLIQLRHSTDHEETREQFYSSRPNTE